MLPLYEAYRKYDVPEKLKGEIFNAEDEVLSELDKLNKINILVGPNNSGKSLLLRELIKTNSKFYYGQDRWDEIANLMCFIDEAPRMIAEASGLPDFSKFLDVHSGPIIDLSIFPSIYAQVSKYSPNYDVKAAVGLLQSVFLKPFEFSDARTYSFANHNNYNSGFNTQSNRELLLKIFDSINKLKDRAQMITQRLSELSLPDFSEKRQRVYIPTFRSLKEFNNLQIDLTIRKDYNFNQDVEIYTGQSFARAVENHKNNEYPYRKKIERFESFLGRTFFQNQKVILTFQKDGNVLLIKIGDEKDRPIYELGDGLQMVIILTFPFFMYDSGIIAIEEPELFIHPGLQKEFVKFLIEDPRVKNFQVYLSTHSNHILDCVNISNQVSIFSVSKRRKKTDSLMTDEQVPDFVVDNLAFGDRNILSLLGVTSTSVYLSNCVVWVEGITDKIYLQKYINAYFDCSKCKEKYNSFRYLKEGIHYTFSLTGGDSIIHWDFAEDSAYDDTTSKILVHKFCAKSFVIIDGDFGKNKDRKAKLREVLDGRVLELKFPEMENLLSPDLVPLVLNEYRSVKNALRISQIPAVTENDLLNNRMGDLIDSVVLKNCTTCKGFSSETGSLKSNDKYEFCLKAIKFIDGNSISDYACEVVEKILDFIIDMNSATVYDLS
jgi:AAA15 family ATPase/GTPase